MTLTDEINTIIQAHCQLGHEHAMRLELEKLARTMYERGAHSIRNSPNYHQREDMGR